MKWNYNFCKKAVGKKDYDFYYCYEHCNKTCPSVSNIWHGKIVRPISMIARVLKCGFAKCYKKESRCSFKYGRYCGLKGKCNGANKASENVLK